ncbi:MAG: hypothetical protein ABI690_35295 [Chloroflexota bacterium]
MSKKLFVLLAVIALLLISIGAVGAQGNGIGNGNCDPQQSTCPNNSQYNAHNNGGMGPGNAQTNNGRGARGNGNMNRGMGQNSVGSFVNLPPAFEGELPQEVIDLMMSGWLDEQNAYAVYAGVIGQFGDVRPFVNIQQAEAQHIDAWEFLFARYEIAIPEIPTVDVPQFASLAEACQVAADAEIANFGLYDTMLETFAAYPDISQVASALRNASEFNHLPAFERCTRK